MKVYKVPKRNDPNTEADDGHAGYIYTYSKREANTLFKEGGADPKRGDEIEELEFAMNKRSVLEFLNLHCSHPDNG
jgi:hypothetical protein